jgi:hypothetical protein
VWVDGLADASGTYLPGPTELGVDVMFLRAPPAPLLNPNVYFAWAGTSGRSFGKYYGPGVYSREFNYIYKQIF